jgi:type I restriction enzyme S subunit
VLPFTRSAIERADYRGATPTKTESGVFLVTARNVRKGWIDYEISKEYVAESEYLTIMRRGLPKRGDLLLTMEAPLGNAALVDREDIAMAQRVVRFRFDSDLVEPRFVLLSVLSPYFQHQLLRRGTGSTALGIKASKLPQLQLIAPPLTEQRALLNYIDNECRPLDFVKGQAESEIDLLSEYRTRLIADVVTGKLDVRDVTADLPSEEESDLDDTDTEAESQDTEASGEIVTLEPIEA